MLRQVFLLYQKEKIFSYFFGQAYDSATLDLLFNKKLESFITNPIEGKVFSKPLFDFQAHFGMFKGVFYLFVTDMSDRPKTIAKEIERTAKLFAKHFADPMEIQSPTPGKEEFTLFIKETHYFLHPKMALMGPLGAGKTTIASLLGASGNPDKRIMNFAVYYQVKLGEISFDLWDFIESDDFSPLWNNFIRGSDIIFFILDSSQSKLSDQKIKYFLNLLRREGKYSKWALILTHRNNPDFIDGIKLSENYDTFKGKQIFEVDLTDGNIQEQLTNIFSETIGLKRSLPADFRVKLQRANDFVGTEDYNAAILLLQELVQICNDYQEYGYLEVFKNKIIELEAKAKKKHLLEEREKKKIKAPKKVSFGSFKGAKTLPGGGNLPGLPSLPTKPVPSLPSLPSLPKIAQPEETQQNDILSNINDANPFFGGLSPIENIPSVSQKMEEKPPTNENSMQTIPQMESGAPLEHFKIQTHKISPINIKKIESPLDQTIRAKLDNKGPKDKFSGIKAGETRSKTLTLERSPIVRRELTPVKRDIQKSKPVQPTSSNNPLDSFTLAPAQEPAEIIPDEVRLQKEIQAMGEDLSIALCEKFINQLKLRMRKTNLTDTDIKKAASLFVIQRKRKANLKKNG